MGQLDTLNDDIKNHLKRVGLSLLPRHEDFFYAKVKQIIEWRRLWDEYDPDGLETQLHIDMVGRFEEDLGDKIVESIPQSDWDNIKQICTAVREPYRFWYIRLRGLKPDDLGLATS
jgi:hypothetical protein